MIFSAVASPGQCRTAAATSEVNRNDLSRVGKKVPSGAAVPMRTSGAPSPYSPATLPHEPVSPQPTHRATAETPVARSPSPCLAVSSPACAAGVSCGPLSRECRNCDSRQNLLGRATGSERTGPGCRPRPCIESARGHHAHQRREGDRASCGATHHWARAGRRARPANREALPPGPATPEMPARGCYARAACPDYRVPSTCSGSLRIGIDTRQY